MTATMTRPQSATTRSNDANTPHFHCRYRKGQHQPPRGLPLEQHPVWTRLRETLMTVTPADLEGLSGRVDEIIRWGHALMRAPGWQRARIGRHVLNGLPAQLAETLRAAADYGADSEDCSLAVVRHFGLTLPGAPQTVPVALTAADDEW